MTRNEHVYAVQNIINRGAQPDDNRFTNRLVHHFLLVVRSLLLKRKIDKNHFVAPENFQSICMPLIETTFHDCDCVPNLDCKILRSKYKLPKQLVGRTEGSVRVTYFDGNPIGLTTIASFSKNQYSRTSTFSGNEKDKVFGFLYDGYVWIVGTLSLGGIMVHGLFENPDDVQDYSICDSDGNEDDNSVCYDPETDEFPIDAELVMPMYQETIRMLTVGNQFPEDNENNARLTQVVKDQE